MHLYILFNGVDWQFDPQHGMLIKVQLKPISPANQVLSPISM